MRKGIVTILDDRNFVFGMVALQSCLDNIFSDITVVVYTPRLSSGRREVLKRACGNHPLIIKRKAHDAILSLPWRDLRNYCDMICMIDSTILACKRIDHLFEKYAGMVAVGERIARVYERCVDTQYDYGFVIADIRQVIDDSLGDAIRKKNYERIDPEDYFYIHPMVSVEELNHTLGKNYDTLREIKESAAIVRVYASVETRLREQDAISRRWVRTAKEIPGVYEELTMPDVGKGKKRRGLSIIRHKEDILYRRTYLWRIPVRKVFNFALWDRLLEERCGEIGIEIDRANERMQKYYERSRGTEYLADITTEGIEEKIQELALYDRLRKLREGVVSRKDEIRKW